MQNLTSNNYAYH